MRFWLGLAGGAFLGYGVGRIVEARAHGVPLDQALLASPFKSVVDIKREIQKRASDYLMKQADALAPVSLDQGAQAHADGSIDAEYESLQT